jgi:serine/threonine protein kinase
MRASSSSETGTRRERAAPLDAGDVVGGQYRIERLVGEGGMGRVYAATELATGKTVALKWMLADASDDRAAARLRREVRAGAIDHPNVVSVLDLGHHGETPFIVMELLSGAPLRAMIDGSPVEPAKLVRTLLPALEGIGAAHARGIVHRDLKPENVFVCTGKDGSYRGTKVLDFGISRLAEDLHGTSSLTRSGAIVGTPHYMSPEQLLGERDKIDARTDIYALGVILYEGLTGRLPYTAETVTALAVQIATVPLKRPSAIVPGLDAKLETVVMRALAREPVVRFQDIASLSRALEPFALEPEEQAGPPRRTRGWVVPLAVIVVACGLLLAGIAAWSGTTRPSARDDDEVESPHARSAPPAPAASPAPEPRVTAPLEVAPSTADEPAPAPSPRATRHRALRPQPRSASSEPTAPAPTAAPRRAPGVRTEGVATDEF